MVKTNILFFTALGVISTANAAQAQMGNDMLSDRQSETIDMKYIGTSEVVPEVSVSGTYGFSNRQSGTNESTGNSLTLNYSRDFPVAGIKEFMFVSGLSTDSDTPISSTDGNSGTIGYGRSKLIG